MKTLSWTTITNTTPQPITLAVSLETLEEHDLSVEKLKLAIDAFEKRLADGPAASQTVVGKRPARIEITFGGNLEQPHKGAANVHMAMTEVPTDLLKALALNPQAAVYFKTRPTGGPPILSPSTRIDLGV